MFHIVNDNIKQYHNFNENLSWIPTGSTDQVSDVFNKKKKWGFVYIVRRSKMNCLCPEVILTGWDPF